MNTTCDALIIGGGPGGATAALLLARAGWSVAVIEKAAFPRGKVCGEFLSATNLPLLRELGVAEDFRELAGPEVRQVGLFAREVSLVAAMPRPANGDDAWGRALGRERLDTLLLERAAAAGAEVWQPWSAIVLSPKGGEFVCQASSRQARQNQCRLKTIKLWCSFVREPVCLVDRRDEILVPGGDAPDAPATAVLASELVGIRALDVTRVGDRDEHVHV